VIYSYIPSEAARFRTASHSHHLVVFLLLVVTMQALAFAGLSLFTGGVVMCRNKTKVVAPPKPVRAVC